MEHDREQYEKLVRGANPVHPELLADLRRHAVRPSRPRLLPAVMVGIVPLVLLAGLAVALLAEADRVAETARAPSPTAESRPATSQSPTAATREPASSATATEAAATPTVPTPTATPVRAVPVLNGLYYVEYGDAAVRLTEIDPVTLEDVGQPLTAEMPPLSSADGSTHVWLDGERDSGGGVGSQGMNIRVYDGRSRKLRASYHPPDVGRLSAISPDGSRLLYGAGTNVPNVTGNWYVLDTSTGRVLRLIQAPGGQALMDAALSRLYVLTTPTAAPGDGARPVRLTGYDLHTGRKLGTVVLRDLRAGTFRLEGYGEAYVAELWQPGLALSPDGRTVALVHPNRNLLTLVDTQTMGVRETMPIARRQSFLEWLGLAPRTAEAKVFKGTLLNAKYSPDGRLLYVTGQESDIVTNKKHKSGEGVEWTVEGPEMETRGLGLRVVDATTGEIVREALRGQRVEWLEPSPDGSALYTFGNLRGDSWDCPCVLRRLDARTLEVTAERRFGGFYEFRYYGSEER